MQSEKRDPDVKQALSDGQVEIQLMRTHLQSAAATSNKDLFSPLFRLFHSLNTSAKFLGSQKMQLVSEKALENLSTKNPQQNFSELEVRTLDKFLSISFDIISGHDVDVSNELTSLELRASAPPLVGLSLKSRVVIIDDEPEILEIISSQLTEHDFEVFSFSDPETALEQLDKIRPDVVLSDYQMPKKTGLDLLKDIKKTNQNLPVVFISGYLNTDVLVEILNLGAYGAIEKPFSLSRAISICTAAVKQYKSQRLLNQSMNHIVRYFGEIDSILREQGKEELRAQINSSIEELLRNREFLNRKI